MKKLLAGVLAVLLPLVAMSDDGKDIKAEVASAVAAFNTAYATNDVVDRLGAPKQEVEYTLDTMAGQTTHR